MTLSGCKPYRLGEEPPADNRPPPRTSIQHGRGPRGSLTPYNGAPPPNVPPQPTISGTSQAGNSTSPPAHLDGRAHPTHARRPPTILPQPPPKNPFKPHVATPTTTPPRPTGHSHHSVVPAPPRRSRAPSSFPRPLVVPAKAGTQGRGPDGGVPRAGARTGASPGQGPGRGRPQGRGAARGRPPLVAPSLSRHPHSHTTVVPAPPRRSRAPLVVPAKAGTQGRGPAGWRPQGRGAGASPGARRGASPNHQQTPYSQR